MSDNENEDDDLFLSDIGSLSQIYENRKPNYNKNFVGGNRYKKRTPYWDHSKDEEFVDKKFRNTFVNKNRHFDKTTKSRSISEKADISNPTHSRYVSSEDIFSPTDKSPGIELYDDAEVVLPEECENSKIEDEKLIGKKFYEDNSSSNQIYDEFELNVKSNPTEANATNSSLGQSLSDSLSNMMHSQDIDDVPWRKGKCDNTKMLYEYQIPSERENSDTIYDNSEFSDHRAGENSDKQEGEFKNPPDKFDDDIMIAEKAFGKWFHRNEENEDHEKKSQTSVERDLFSRERFFSNTEMNVNTERSVFTDELLDENYPNISNVEMAKLFQHKPLKISIENKLEEKLKNDSEMPCLFNVRESSAGSSDDMLTSRQSLESMRKQIDDDVIFLEDSSSIKRNESNMSVSGRIQLMLNESRLKTSSSISANILESMSKFSFATHMKTDSGQKIPVLSRNEPGSKNINDVNAYGVPQSNPPAPHQFSASVVNPVVGNQSSIMTSPIHPPGVYPDSSYPLANPPPPNFMNSYNGDNCSMFSHFTTPTAMINNVNMPPPEFFANPPAPSNVPYSNFQNNLPQPHGWIPPVNPPQTNIQPVPCPVGKIQILREESQNTVKPVQGDAVKEEIRQQNKSLKAQRDQYYQKYNLLGEELNKLKKQKKVLTEGKKSHQAEQFLKENNRLQNEIENKIKAVRNVIDMLSKIIKDDDDKKNEKVDDNSKRISVDRHDLKEGSQKSNSKDIKLKRKYSRSPLPSKSRYRSRSRSKGQRSRSKSRPRSQSRSRHRSRSRSHGRSSSHSPKRHRIRRSRSRDRFHRSRRPHDTRSKNYSKKSDRNKSTPDDTKSVKGDSASDARVNVAAAITPINPIQAESPNEINESLQVRIDVLKEKKEALKTKVEALKYYSEKFKPVGEVPKSSLVTTDANASPENSNAMQRKSFISLSNIMEMIHEKPPTSNEKIENEIVNRPVEKHVNYVYYDPEIHWCQVCNVFPRTAKEYLLHLHDTSHKDELQRRNMIDYPWHKIQPEIKKPVYEDAPSERIPIRGLPFFISATAWYCKLCNEWMGDLHCASAHLKSDVHEENFTAYMELNPSWEENWLRNRGKAQEEQSRNKQGTMFTCAIPPPPISISSSGLDIKLKPLPHVFSTHDVKAKVKTKKQSSSSSTSSSSSSSSNSTSSDSNSSDDDSSTKNKKSKKFKTKSKKQKKGKKEKTGKTKQSMPNTAESSTKSKPWELTPSTKTNVINKFETGSSIVSTVDDDKFDEEWMNPVRNISKEKEFLELKNKLKRKEAEEKSKFMELKRRNVNVRRHTGYNDIQPRSASSTSRGDDKQRRGESETQKYDAKRKMERANEIKNDKNDRNEKNMKAMKENNDTKESMETKTDTPLVDVEQQQQVSKKPLKFPFIGKMPSRSLRKNEPDAKSKIVFRGLSNSTNQQTSKTNDSNMEVSMKKQLEEYDREQDACNMVIDMDINDDEDELVSIVVDDNISRKNDFDETLKILYPDEQQQRQQKLQLQQQQQFQQHQQQLQQQEQLQQHVVSSLPADQSVPPSQVTFHPTLANMKLPQNLTQDYLVSLIESTLMEKLKLKLPSNENENSSKIMELANSMQQAFFTSGVNTVVNNTLATSSESTMPIVLSDIPVPFDQSTERTSHRKPPPPPPPPLHRHTTTLKSQKTVVNESVNDLKIDKSKSSGSETDIGHKKKKNPISQKKRRHLRRIREKLEEQEKQLQEKIEETRKNLEEIRPQEIVAQTVTEIQMDSELMLLGIDEDDSAALQF